MNTAVGAGEVSFEYKGILDGKYTEGIIAALNRDEASFKLKTQRVIITSLVLVKGQKKQKAKAKSGGISLFAPKVKPKDVMIFMKKLSTMVKAGLPVLESLKMVASQTDHKTLQEIVATIGKDLESGVALSKCFEKQSHFLFYT